MFKQLVVTLFFVSVVSLAYAGLDDGIPAYDKGDYAQAYKVLKPLAEHGNAEAQSRLGWMYNFADGVPKDYGEAVESLADRLSKAMYSGQCYMGVMYEMGHGVAQDYAVAKEFYLKAAQQGDATAKVNLGWLYIRGDGVPQDFVQAHMWLNLAAAQGYTPAQRYRNDLATKMTPSQIAEAQHLTREWNPKGRTEPEGYRVIGYDAGSHQWTILRNGTFDGKYYGKAHDGYLQFL